VSAGDGLRQPVKGTSEVPSLPNAALQHLPTSSGSFGAIVLKNSRFAPLCLLCPDYADLQAYNFNSLTIRAWPEIRSLAVESGGDGVFQHNRA
jgi:hypothetical protein